MLDFHFEMYCHLPNAMAELIKHNNVNLVHPKKKKKLVLQNGNSEMITSIRPNFKAAHAIFVLLETLNNQIFVDLSDIERICKPLSDILNVMFDECNSQMEGTTSNDTTKQPLITNEVEVPAKKMETELEENKPSVEQVVGSDDHFDEEELQLISKKQATEHLKKSGGRLYFADE
ncbi:hypothetical protein PR048_009401 [Dryococelus australis]|uniref:Uncharacterized protein n=1 Tax=Dryococelus australis TaxID=614101 RepID=A0ABQ9I0H8_9NEOP|nr:hypothetical protein PR048_009401 [Dryococelus australis]